MKIALRFSLIIFFLGIAVLILSMIAAYTLTHKRLLEDRLDYREMLVNEISLSIEHYIKEKVNVVKTLSVAPVLKNMLKKSNLYYGEMTENERKDKIQDNNNRWQNETAESPFVKDYLNNGGADYLKIQQKLFENEYGEIFLTDKHGALVASTEKLTTFAHSYKYWWEAAYNNGKGKVFLDDRGYDDSVHGYVLGLVIPIYEENEIIGILKANLSIMKGLGNYILNMQTPEVEKIQLIRSNGLVLFEENTLPLSKELPAGMMKQLHPQEHSAFIYDNKQSKWLVGYSPIAITWGSSEFGFGGSAESIDHKGGNTGQEWLVLDLVSFQSIAEELSKLLSNIMVIGIILLFVLAFIAYLIGHKVSQPIKKLAEETNKITAGDFSSKISINRKDEIGLLAQSFNKMIESLQKSTTSIKKLNSEVEKRKATEKQLEAAKNLAEAANIAKSEFLSTVSHELRTPLNGVIGFSEILKLTGLNKDQNKYVDTVLSSANNLLEIISDILDYSSIDAKNYELQAEETNLKTLIQKTCSIIQHKAVKKGLKFILVIAEDIPQTVIVDSGKLRQILLNLLSNAIKFTEKGSVIFKLNMVEKTDDKVRILFTVTDTGIGIKEKDQKQILNAFHQVDMSSTRKYEGTGLGLAICKKLLQKMDSTLKLKSNYGQCSTFSFELQLSYDEDKEVDTVHREMEEMAIPLSFKDKKVLIVEDNQINMHYAQTALSFFSKDIQIIQAKNGKEAYHYFRKHNPDLILMDIIMPDVDGYQATSMIRAHNEDVPIIAMTAKASKDDRENCLAAGMDDYIIKPVSLEQLKEILIKYL